MERSCVTILVVLLAIGVVCLEEALVWGFDYGDALEKTLMFFEAQRSGRLPADQRIRWRSDSGLRDGLSQQVDLVGGYYDAGDHVKFGLPLGYTVTVISWAAVDYRREIESVGMMGYTLSTIKWATDYLIKAHPRPFLLWGQVGDGESDHYCWERSEDMTTPRNAYKIDPSYPGSDLAGETAAAMAAASLAFRPFNSSYSEILLQHARQLFTLADQYRGLYDDSITSAKEFYKSSGYADELLWGATWLYRATNEEQYLQYVVDNTEFMGGTNEAYEFSWDNKYAALQVLLSKVLIDGNNREYTETLERYRVAADSFACYTMRKNAGKTMTMTPGGLLFYHRWNNLQYVSSASFLLAVYSDYLSPTKLAVKCSSSLLQPQDLLNFAMSQTDYILGKNPMSMSYLVGYGTKYPRHVHHRDASIPSKQVLPRMLTCDDGFNSYYRALSPDPNVIVGALVGGPDDPGSDNYSDRRDNYQQSEPTISGTAPLVGLFARLYITPQCTGNRRRRVPNQARISASFPNSMPTTSNSEVPIIFIHSITNQWYSEGQAYYRHRVAIKNTSDRPIRGLKLRVDNLNGIIYGLKKTGEKDIYEIVDWKREIEPQSSYVVAYVQDGAQAIFSIVSYL